MPAYGLDSRYDRLPLLPEVMIYHDDDDGFGSACVVEMMRRALRPEHTIEYYPTNYGRPFNLLVCKDKHVLIADFSFKAGPMLDIHIMSKTLRVLDHHKTAEAELAQLIAGEAKNDIEFDMARSGVKMTMDFFARSEMIPDCFDPPELIGYLDAGDLWQPARFDDLFEVQAALRSFPYSFDLWVDHFFKPEGMAHLRVDGAAIKRFFDLKCDDVLEGAREIWLPDGTACLGVNAPYFMASTVAGTLAERAHDGVGCAYWDGKIDRVFSLRSRSKVDVSVIAQANGGGGHANAAGFSCSFDQLWQQARVA